MERRSASSLWLGSWIAGAGDRGRHNLLCLGFSCSALSAPYSLFNLLTARELGPKFGPRSVPYALGGKQDMKIKQRARSCWLRGVADRLASARATLWSVLLLVPALASGQNPPLPPPSQAASALQQAVQQNPGLADMIRQRIAQSGMTSEQVRARLQASGYPPTLLDAYLGAQTPGQASPLPGAQEIAAIQSLGVPTLATAGENLPAGTRLGRGTAAGKSGGVGRGGVARDPPPILFPP